MKKIFQISLVVLLVLAFTFAVVQVLPGCNATGTACTNVGWNSRAAAAAPVAFLVGTLPGPTTNVGWNS